MTLGAENEYMVFFKIGDFKPQVIEAELDADIINEEYSPILYTKPPVGMILISQNYPLFDSWLKNGGRVYRDGDYTEYATPECDTVEELVLTEKAGEKIMSKIFSNKDQENLYVLKRTSSAEFHNETEKEKTGGSHENYLIDKNLFNKLIKKSTPESPTYHNEQIALIGHLASRIIYTGAGHISAKFINHLDRKLNFWISPRVCFLKTIVSNANRMYRPFIHGREESLVNETMIQKNRLHLIFGDMNRSPWSLYLKYGTTALILALLEIATPDTIAKLAKSVNLRHPINFAIALSGKMRSFFATQEKFDKAIDMQIQLIATVEEYKYLIKSRLPEIDKILELWKKTINSLVTGDGYLSDKLDWIIKKNMYEKVASSPIKDLPKIKDKNLIKKLLQYDLSYHRVNNHDLFEGLTARGKVSSAYKIKLENNFFNKPPNGRAQRRVEMLKYIINNNLQNYIPNSQLWRDIELYKTTPKEGLDLAVTGNKITIWLDITDIKKLKLEVDKFKNIIGGQNDSNIRTGTGIR